MRRPLLILGLLVALALGLAWALGGLAMLERAAVDWQREVQNALAGAIRQLKGGQPGAVTALLAVSFAYGFFHAAGPGHGKFLIGSYGLASRRRLVPLATIAVVSSLAQAATAVVLVYAGIWIFGWTKERLAGVNDHVLLPLSHAAFAAIGLWLCLRGWRHLSAQRVAAAPAAAHSQDHGHHHDHHPHDHHHHTHHQDEACGCGHAHGPTLEQVENLHSWRETFALIGSIALRPCTGALFILVLTWQMGIGAMGVAGAFVMGLGTASVTLAVAGLSVWAREGALATLPGQRVARAVPLLEIGFGLLIALIAGQMLIASL